MTQIIQNETDAKKENDKTEMFDDKIQALAKHLDLNNEDLRMIEENDDYLTQEIINALELKVGRIIFNGVPTGVEVCPSMTHGGPYPASTDSRFSAVGINSIKRWLRPVSFQDFPQNLLPSELKNNNPLNIERNINGITTREGDSLFKI